MPAKKPTIDDLSAAGYEVTESHPATSERAAIYHASGHGFRGYLLQDDDGAIRALAAISQQEGHEESSHKTNQPSRRPKTRKRQAREETPAPGRRKRT